ncbi:hypothetical protein Tco_0009832, partial [Tanacetum coccineum]
KLKRNRNSVDLQVSTGGFKEVCDKLCLVVKHEFNEIKVKLADEKIKVLHSCNTPVYRKLLYHVSQFALKAICKQYEKITKGTMAPCTGHFTATMGLPCAHKIINSRETKLSLDLIHPHWRIDTLTFTTTKCWFWVEEKLGSTMSTLNEAGDHIYSTKTG